MGNAIRVVDYQWFDVTSYGAVNEDSSTYADVNRLAFQAALDAIKVEGKGVLYIPQGVWVVSKSPTIHCMNFSGVNNLIVRGAGIGSTIVKRKAGTYPGDTHIFQCKTGNTSNVVFEDLTLDGNKANCTDSDEQRHLLYLSGQGTSVVNNVWVNRCEFKNSRGDGIFMLGDVGSDPTSAVNNVWVTNSRFYYNRRSGGAHQRGCHYIHWLHNYFELDPADSDQDLDFEATGAGALTNLWVIGNVFKHSTDTFSVALSGFVGEPMDNVIFENNIMLGGHFITQHVAHASIKSNIFIGRDSVSENPITVDIRGETDHLVFEGNYVQHNCDLAGTDAAVRVSRVSVSAPRHCTVKNNTIELITAPTGIVGLRLENMGEDIEFSGNTVIGNGAASSTGIYSTITNDGITRYDLRIIGNKIKNFVKGILVHSSNGATKYNNVRIQDNDFYDTQVSPTQTIGIELDSNAVDWVDSQTLTISGNQFGRGITTEISYATVDFPVIAMGGMGAGVKAHGIYLVNATPEGLVTAPIGSLAVRKDNGAAYSKTTGTGNTGWTAL